MKKEKEVEDEGFEEGERGVALRGFKEGERGWGFEEEEGGGS